jgi:hypothetical protein
MEVNIFIIIDNYVHLVHAKTICFCLTSRQLVSHHLIITYATQF